MGVAFRCWALEARLRCVECGDVGVGLKSGAVGLWGADRGQAKWCLALFAVAVERTVKNLQTKYVNMLSIYIFIF